MIAQMRQINSKLSKLDNAMKAANAKIGDAITKGDGSLRNEIKELFNEMKEDLLQSIIKGVDIIESKLFDDRDQEIDQLKVQNKALEEQITKSRHQNADAQPSKSC